MSTSSDGYRLSVTAESPRNWRQAQLSARAMATNGPGSLGIVPMTGIRWIPLVHDGLRSTG